MSKSFESGKFNGALEISSDQATGSSAGVARREESDGPVGELPEGIYRSLDSVVDEIEEVFDKQGDKQDLARSKLVISVREVAALKRQDILRNGSTLESQSAEDSFMRVVLSQATEMAVTAGVRPELVEFLVSDEQAKQLREKWNSEWAKAREEIARLFPKGISLSAAHSLSNLEIDQIDFARSMTPEDRYLLVEDAYWRRPIDVWVDTIQEYERTGAYGSDISTWRINKLPKIKQLLEQRGGYGPLLWDSEIFLPGEILGIPAGLNWEHHFGLMQALARIGINAKDYLS